MTFSEFLAYVRENVDRKHTTEYWFAEYNRLPSNDKNSIKQELPFIAIRAKASAYRGR